MNSSQLNSAADGVALSLCVGREDACRGTVLADSDSDSDDDDDDDDGDAGGGDALLARAQRRCHQTKQLGTVRVMWDDCDVSRHRVGREGHVDIWCIDAAPGGQYYRDHLAVLDTEMMSTSGGGFAADDNKDDDDDDDDDDAEEVMRADVGTCCIGTPLGRRAAPYLFSLAAVTCSFYRALAH